MKSLKKSSSWRWLKGSLLTSFLLLASPVDAQSCAYSKSLDESSKLCAALSGSNFYSNQNADMVLNKILSAIGASKRFILKECSGVSNASAASYKGIRYIFYNDSFMSKIAGQTNDWSNLSILAHEVGHHINGHTLDLVLYAGDIVKKVSLEESRKQELEADEFSGFVLGQLGATSAQATQVMKLIATDENDSNSTHPAKSKRLAALLSKYSNK